MADLKGLKVVDASQFLAGPIVSLYLAAFGADVVKVEKPSGDDARDIGPFWRDIREEVSEGSVGPPRREGESSYFMSLNRGKRSLALDLKKEEGREVFVRLVRGADVLVENYRPGVMDRLGVGYARLREINPRLIYAAASGFGPVGPHAQRPAFDSLLQAAGGLISVTGPAEGPPVRVGVSISDITSGLFLLIGVLSALLQRERTGRGQRVDISMLAATVNLMENPVVRHSVSGEVPKPEGLAHPVVAPFAAYPTADGLLYLAISNTNRFRVLVEALGKPELAEDSRFRENADRVRNDALLRPILEEIFRTKTTEEWERELIPRGVPVTAINNVAEVKARFPECFVEVLQPEGGSLLMSGSPFFFSDASPDFSRPAPRLGEHTDEVLRELGYTAEEIERLRACGAV